MSDFMKELYSTVNDLVRAQCLHREERAALARQKAPLYEFLLRRLGDDGADILDRFLNLDDEIAELHDYEVFRYALALGLELGHLPGALSV